MEEAILGAIGAVFCVVLAAVVYFKAIKPFKAKIASLLLMRNNMDALAAEIDAINAKIEAMELSRTRSEAGKLGNQIKEELKEETSEALNEGREVIQAPGGLEEKKAGLIELIKKHPRVAEIVGRKLNREFGISKMLGISEMDLLAQVGAVIAQQAPAQEQTKSSFDF